MEMVSLRYIVKRSLITIILLWVVLTTLFVLMKSLPGSYLVLMENRGVPQSVITNLAEQYHLNAPLHIQYIFYIKSVLAGNWGVSLQLQKPVVDVVGEKIFRTFILVAPGVTFAYLIGSLYGAIAGTNPGSFLEKYGIVPIIMSGSVPTFVSSIFLIIIFSGMLGWFPPSGMVNIQTELALADGAWWRKYVTTDFLWHYTLPFTAVVFRYLFYPSLIMRTSISEVSNEAFVYFNRMAGLSKRTRLYHIARHASLPVITMYPISLSRSIGGLVLIETVFNWPGIGAALVGAVLARDFPVVIFVFFTIATFIILSNFIVDILYGILDPRVDPSD